jgi:hypothetical protein
MVPEAAVLIRPWPNWQALPRRLKTQRRSSTIEVKAFTGKAMRCRKAFAGFSNCCKDSGWGQSAGLAACDDEEKLSGRRKRKNHRQRGRAVRSQVLGACIQKSQVYCVFDGKLARIIQEQGRRDQLGVKFGSGDSPNCRGSRSRSCRVSTSTKSTSLTSTRI